MANSLAAIGPGKNLRRYNAVENASVVESLVNSVSVGVIFVDMGGILTYMNKRAELVLQVDRRSVLGKRVDMLPLKTPIYKAMSENCRENPLEMNILGRGLLVQSSEVRTDDGILLGEVTEFRDVTSEKKEKRQREEFVAMMTHDLKSPLMVMLGHVQAIKLGMWGTVDSQIRASMEEIERSGLNLGSMLENVLDIYRLEMGRVQIKRDLCDIGEVLKNCCRDGQVQALDQGVKLSLQISDGMPHMFVDGRQLARVFGNLIGNAVKFTPRNGKVAITAEIRDDILCFSVRDTGIGIPPKDLSRIFNKYFRSDKASGFKGTGLGLTISRAIVDAHDGAIDVESIEGRGSMFTVKIPLSTQSGE